jgi:hypothetical protein
MTLVKEDGSGLPNSNSYADIDDGNTYHEVHLYATDWTDAAPDVKEASLMMATRVLDMNMEFKGWKGDSAQALEWPRIGVPNHNELWYVYPGASLFGGYLEGPYFPSNVVPVRLNYATCELARELIASNRTEDYKAKGISAFSIGQGAISLNFSGSTSDRPQTFTDQIRAMLQPLGTMRIGRSMVRVRRG